MSREPRPPQGAKALIYARSSADADAQEPLSRDPQTEACAAVSEAAGWKVIGVYKDGPRSARSAFSAAMTAAEEGAIDVIIATSLDRISRDPRDMQETMKRLGKTKALLHTVDRGMITRKR